MKNKGFVLMETIVVIVVISVALLTIFSSYNKILTKVKTENKYDTSEYIYMTYYIKENIKSICNLATITPDDISNNTITNYADCNGGNKFSIFGVEKIYILTNLNTAGTHVNKFDSYMIDYIRKLDVFNTDKLIIVEYKRPSLNKNSTQREMVTNNTNIIEKRLYETYIASLEWK